MNKLILSFGIKSKCPHQKNKISTLHTFESRNIAVRNQQQKMFNHLNNTKMKQINQKSMLILCIATVLFSLSFSSKANNTSVIAGWDFTSINSTLGTHTGIAIASTHINGTQTQSLTGGQFGSFKRVSSTEDGVFEIVMQNVTTTSFSLQNLSMDIVSNGATSNGGNFQVFVRSENINSGNYTVASSIVNYSFAASETINYSAQLADVSTYDNLSAVDFKIVFKVAGPNTRTIKIDNLLINGTTMTSTTTKELEINQLIKNNTLRNEASELIHIYDANAKLIIHSNSDIDLSALKNGIYFIKMSTQSFKYFKK